MTSLVELLGARRPALFDGGMGTLLQERGLAGGGCGELWNVERPDVIRGIHTEYADAGADVLTTNTFGGTRPRLAMHGVSEQVTELSRAGAALAHGVAEDSGCLVAGGLGPTGELLEPLGSLEFDEAVRIFAEQLAGLAAGGIDLVLIETMSDLREVQAAVDAATTVVPKLPVAVTLSFDTNLRTMMGVTPAAAVTTLAAAGVDAVGANCGRGLDELEAIVQQLVAVRPQGQLLVGQSNAGLPQLVGDRFEYDVAPSTLAAHALRLRELGVDLIGSCCGSTPAHTAAMRSVLTTG
ncbi:MAG: homocysteine S-methyltransferase family protein [Nocardioidaceae bacterium]